MKKLALILFGISYLENFNHWTDQTYTIDFRKSFKNYKKYIYAYFHDLNYEIDVYFATNQIDDDNLNTLIHMYKPIHYKMVKNYKNVYRSRNYKLLNAIQCCLESNIEYDMCLITRFDLLFQKDFKTSNLDFNQLNLVSVLEKPNKICDNFYLFPYKLLSKFYTVVLHNQHNIFHDLEEEFLKISKINYILNEHVCIKKLSFYKIVRSKTKKLTRKKTIKD